MLSIEEIKLLIEKLEKVKREDLQKLIDSNLIILKDLHRAVDANNKEEINRIDKTEEWYRLDLEKKRERPIVNPLLFKIVQQKIFQFGKTNQYNSLEIGPGTGMFSKEFRAWGNNYYLDILPDLEQKIRRRFSHPAHNKYLKFFTTRKTECSDIPQGSCNFVFSWDTFVFFTQEHIQQYMRDIKRVLIPGGYCLINYADCHYDHDLLKAQRGYWNYNTKSAMKRIILKEGYEIVEMSQFMPGANYFVCRKPGKQNPVLYRIEEISID